MYDDPAHAQAVTDLKKEVARLRDVLDVPAAPPEEAFGQVRREKPARKGAG